MGGETTQQSSQRPETPAGAYRLLVLYAPDARDVGRTTQLEQALTLGRMVEGPDSLQLADPQASRRHLRIAPRAEGFVAEDLGSSNGTRLRGQPLTGEAVLQSGDILRIGDTLLLFQYLSYAECQVLLTARRSADALLIGPSAKLALVRQRLSAVAPDSAPVLLWAETGCGKELAARTLHAESGRPGQLVPVNAAALPEQLVESELFGHARGAFTGAGERSQGLFGQADKGTLFLDEIGDMPVALQPRLLRALGTGEVRGVGESQVRHVDVRCVAATHVDLEQAVATGQLRGDLYARLRSHMIEIPPLRARPEDILPLCHHFMSQTGRSGRVEPDVAEMLVLHGWPFNVRELEQVVRAAVATESASEAVLRLSSLPPAISAQLRSPIPTPGGPRASGNPAAYLALRVRRDAEPTPEELAEVLRHLRGNMSEVAEFFGRHRKQVYRWLEKAGLDADAYR